MSIATCSSSTAGISSPRAGDWRQGNLHIFHQTKDTKDVKFLVGAEKQEIMAHSFVLLHKSPEFVRILPPTRDKNEHIEIVLPQYDPKSFELLLMAIYVGELPETDDDAIDFIELLKLVRTFKPELESVCKSRVTKRLKDWKTALKALQLEDLEIKHAALEIICRNSDEVLNSVEFINLPLNSLKEILKLDELDVDETEIFQALIRWAENKTDRSENSVTGSLSKEKRGKRIRNEIGDLIHLIRFPLMRQEYFLEEVAPLKILTDFEKGKISKYMIRLSRSKDCDTSPFSCKPRRNKSERTISSSTHSEEGSSMVQVQLSRAAIPGFYIDDSDDKVKPMQIPKSERRRNASGEPVEEPRRKTLRVSGNAGLSITRHIEDNSVDAPIHEDDNPATNEATSENALMDQEESLQPTTSRGSEGNQRDSMIAIPSSSIHPMTAIKVTPGMNTAIKENSWIHLQTESPDDMIWFDSRNQVGNIMFLDQGLTLNVYTIQSTPTNELLKLKCSIPGYIMPNNLACLRDIWHPPVDLVDHSPILFSLQGTKLNAYDLQNGEKVVAEMDLPFPEDDIEYGKLGILDEYIYIEHFFKAPVAKVSSESDEEVSSESSESDDDESTQSTESRQNDWADKEMVQKLLILEVSHSPTLVVKLLHKIRIPEEALGKDFKDIKRHKKKLYVKTGTKVEIFDIWDLKDKGARKILRGEEHDAATFNKHPNLETVTIQQMPDPQCQFDNTEGLTAIVSKRSPHLHVLSRKTQNYSIYNVEDPKKTVRTISNWKGKNEKIKNMTYMDDSTFPFLMCHYKNSGFILINADEPGPITNSVLTTSHIFPMERKSGNRKRKGEGWNRIDPAKKEMRWPNWIFASSQDYKRKIGICSIDTDNKMIYVSIHDMGHNTNDDNNNTKDLKKNIEKLPPLKIEEWGIPKKSVNEMDIFVYLNDNFVRVLYGKNKDWQNFIYCRSPVV